MVSRNDGAAGFLSGLLPPARYLDNVWPHPERGAKKHPAFILSFDYWFPPSARRNVLYTQLVPAALSCYEAQGSLLQASPMNSARVASVSASHCSWHLILETQTPHVQPLRP